MAGTITLVEFAYLICQAGAWRSHRNITEEALRLFLCQETAFCTSAIAEFFDINPHAPECT